VKAKRFIERRYDQQASSYFSEELKRSYLLHRHDTTKVLIGNKRIRQSSMELMIVAVVVYIDICMVLLACLGQ
jgi:hypothetical protein